MTRCNCEECVGSRNRRNEIRHGGVTEEELPRSRRKKTSRWCRGKVGREHDFQWQRVSFGNYSYNREECSSCGKHGRYQFLP